MHAKRLLVALILLPLFYFSVMGLPEWCFFALLLTASALAQWELYSMYRVTGLMKSSGMLFGVLMLAAAYLSTDPFPYVSMLAVMVIFAIRLFGVKDPASSLRDISFTLLTLLYIPGLLAFQFLLRDRGPQWIIFLYGCVWVSDSVAYYVGKSMGKRKLYREISPNKTVAGAVGSLMGGALSGWVLNMTLVRSMGTGESLVVGVIIGAVTIVGDLVESMFKRDAGVKDSSGIVPGHGGILDKIDGVLFAGPVLYLVSEALGVMR
jgi:phosphatidate cytidylyltransferase